MRFLIFLLFLSGCADNSFPVIWSCSNHNPPHIVRHEDLRTISKEHNCRLWKRFCYKGKQKVKRIDDNRVLVECVYDNSSVVIMDRRFE